VTDLDAVFHGMLLPVAASATAMIALLHAPREHRVALLRRIGDPEERGRDMPPEEKQRRRPVCVVTGASAGVGRATAIEFARAGYDVGLIARGADGLRSAVDDVLFHGGRALAVQADVADWDAVRAAARSIESQIGPVDVWVNNAMTTVFAPVTELDPAELRRATEVTYFGQVHGAMAALELMRARDRGVIVSVGSALAFRAIPLQAPYCGSKFAVRGFMEALRTELLHQHSKIRVSTVHLPAMNTPQFGWCRSRLPDQPSPVPPIYQPEVAARAIVAVARSGHRQRIVGGWNWLIVQGNKLAPGVFDHYAARTSWSAQQVAGEKVERRPGNLDRPLDDDPGTDRGAHGRFDDRVGGVATAHFLKTVPQTVRSVVQAARDRGREVIHTRWRADSQHS
jgi:NAD(P)-dependent dehydrogenase (short-subunit alcohol dehydrogenase family)